MTEYAGHARHMVKGSRENGIAALEAADCSGVLVIGGDGTVCEVLLRMTACASLPCSRTCPLSRPLLRLLVESLIGCGRRQTFSTFLHTRFQPYCIRAPTSVMRLPECSM
jgi:hypothetical protein